MKALPIVGGLIAGLVTGGLTAFFQLIFFAVLWFGAKHLFTLPDNPTAKQGVLFEFVIYVVVVLAVFSIGYVSKTGPNSTRSFFRSFFTTFLLPGILLQYAWQSHG